MHNEYPASLFHIIFFVVSIIHFVVYSCICLIKLPPGPFWSPYRALLLIHIWAMARGVCVCMCVCVLIPYRGFMPIGLYILFYFLRQKHTALPDICSNFLNHLSYNCCLLCVFVPYGCMYVCMCACMHARVCVCMYVCMHAFLCVVCVHILCAVVNVYTCMYKCMCVCVQLKANPYLKQMFLHSGGSLVCVCASVCVCVCVCLCVCVCVCVCVCALKCDSMV